jgi:hypothetical protein
LALSAVSGNAAEAAQQPLPGTHVISLGAIVAAEGTTAPTPHEV